MLTKLSKPGDNMNRVRGREAGTCCNLLGKAVVASEWPNHRPPVDSRRNSKLVA
jgi:hypothetical protein